MNRKNLRYQLKEVKQLDVMYLGAATMVSAGVVLLALRANNQHMVSLRQAVYDVDEANGDVQGALNDLQQFVVGHMNTGLSTGSSVHPPIQLKHTYDRLVTAEKARVDSANSQIYTDAQGYCEGQNSTDFSGRNRVPCIQDYVQQHGVAPKTIPVSLYQFDFVAPKWSPDVAGWSLIITVILAFTLIIRIILGKILKRVN